MDDFVAHYYKVSYYKFGFSATALYIIIQVTSAHLCFCFGNNADKGPDLDVQVLRLTVAVKHYCETEDIFFILNKRNNFK
jgi:hypothetical protein